MTKEIEALHQEIDRQIFASGIDPRDVPRGLSGVNYAAVDARARTIKALRRRIACAVEVEGGRP